MQIDWQQVRRLLVVVSDVEIEITPLKLALQRIRAALMDAEITLLISAYLPDEKSICFPFEEEMGGSVNRVIPYATNWQNPAREKELVEKLKQFGFNAAIVFTGNVKSPYPFAYLAYLAGIPIRIGRSREFGGSVLSHTIKPLDDLLNGNPYLHLLDSVGFPTPVRASSSDGLVHNR